MENELKYRVIRSARHTMMIQIIAGTEIVVRAPKKVSDKKIHDFVQSQEAWIRKHLKKKPEGNAEGECGRSDLPPLTPEELKELFDKALKVIPERVRYYAPIVGVTYGRITIRNQRTRWGSCSSKGNLNFNCLLMLAPPEVLDSVVVHELCHRKEMNHSSKFYAEVYKAFPEYDKWNKWLKEHGSELMLRMIGDAAKDMR